MSGSLPSPHKTISPIRCSEKPWDLWVSEIGHSSPLRDEEPPVAPAEAAKGAPGCRPAPSTSSKHSPHTGVTRLKLSSMCLYGQFPNTDNLNAAVCYMCGMTMKCSAAHRHLVEYHSSSVDPILPPPPPAPTVKLKSSHSKSKYKKELPPPSIGLVEELLPPAPDPPPEAELKPALIPIAPRIVLSQQEMTYFPELEVTGQKCTPSTQSEVKVCVDDNDLPVVSIQDNTDLPLADDIIEIMNSEGIQSIEEADRAAWKNLMQDFGAIQDMTLQNTTLMADGVSTHGLYDANGIPVRMTGTTFALTGDDGTLQYTQPITLTPTLTVDNQCVTFPSHPVQCAPTKPKPKAAKSSSKTTKFASREYDPNKHCGVTTGESQKPCTRSLTCKAHTLSLRRLVDGRIKSFDVLLAEHRAAKQASLVSPPPLIISPLHQPTLVNQPILPNTVNIVSQVSLVSQANLVSPVAVVCSQSSVEPAGMTSPLAIPGQVDISAFGGFPSPEPEVPDYYAGVVGGGLVEEVAVSVTCPVSVVAPAMAPAPAPPRLPEPRPGDVCWYPSSPRPLAACTFSAYHMGNALLLGKRMATVRSNIKATLMQPHSKNVSGYYNFSQNSLSSMGKTMHVNNAAKPAMPEVRKLIMSCPAVSGSSIKTDPGLYYTSGSRHNGHLFSSKRPLMDNYEELDSKCLRTAGSSVSSMRNKVSKHLNQSDMMELNLMFDPLMADEKC